MRLEAKINNPAVMRDIKQRTRALLGSFYYQSMVAKRSLEKPKGYPGDYETLEMAYENKEISKGIGHYMDRHFLNYPYALAVRERKNFMRQYLKDFISSNRQ